MTGVSAARRLRVSPEALAVVSAGMVLLLIAAVVPLAILARQNPLSNAGSSIAFGVPCAAVGFVVAWRKPRNPLGWFMLAVGAGLVISNDAGLYAVADYRLRHGDLPLGWVAVLLQPLWAPAFLSYPLVILLFPDGRLPSRRWRWVMWFYLAVAAFLPAGIYETTVRTVMGHRIQVLPNGDLAAVDHPSHDAAWTGLVLATSLVLLVVFWLAFLGRQAACYRRSSGERRQQLKWLVSGAGVFMAALTLAVVGGVLYRNPPPVVQVLLKVLIIGVVALPTGIGVGILKYRLYDVDRLISRTLAYAIVTGLLIGVYAGLVLLATRVLSLHSQVAVAASTLAAAALFNPLRKRVQRAVDRRFNRARYDAELTVAAFAARLKDAVDLDSVRDDLAGVVHTALEPANVSVWIRGGADQGRSAVTGDVAARRLRLVSPEPLAALGAGVVLLLIAAAVPLAILAHQNPAADTGSSIAIGVPCAAVGYVVARKQPRNPLGWFMIAIGAGLVLANDAGLYSVADYRLHHGGLPLGWVAVLLQPLWAPTLVLYPLVILLFPDGRLPSRRWRVVMWSYLAVGAFLAAYIYVDTIRVIVAHRIQVLANSDLAAVDHPSRTQSWVLALVRAALPLLVVFLVAFLGRQVASYRRSSGERRQQLKWLLSGAAVFMVGLMLLLVTNAQILNAVGAFGTVALPVGIGVGILKYRLYDVDRLISRTLAYVIVTGLLLGLYAGLVLLATRVLSLHSQVAVAASTLAAVALFNPLRRRVQRSVDRRFNRARYDAELTVAAFSARLKDAVDLDAVRDDLAAVVHQALEPAHVSVWVRGRE